MGRATRLRAANASERACAVRITSRRPSRPGAARGGGSVVFPCEARGGHRFSVERRARERGGWHVHVPGRLFVLVGNGKLCLSDVVAA